MEVISVDFGHCATFRTDNASAADAALVKWGLQEISVPSNGTLNVPARICWQKVPTTVVAAKAWCVKVGANFLVYHKSQLRFDVRGFSRYRYVDSDEEERKEAKPADDDGPDIESITVEHASQAHSHVKSGPHVGREICQREYNYCPNSKDRGPARNRRVMTLFVDEDDQDSPPPVIDEFGTASDTLIMRTPRPSRPLVVPSFRSALFSTFSGPSNSKEILRITETRHGEVQRRFHSVQPQSAHLSEVTCEVGAPHERGLRLRFPVTAPFALPALNIPVLRRRSTRFVKRHQCFADRGRAMGRSFRVGFSGGQSVMKPVCSSVRGLRRSSDKFVVLIEPVHTLIVAQTQRSHLVCMLKVHCTAWKLEELNNGLSPKTKHVKNIIKQETLTAGARSIRAPRIDYALEIPEILERVLSDVANCFSLFAPEQKHLVHGSVVFSLLKALHSPNGKHSDTSENLLSRVVDWGRGLAGVALDREIPVHASLRRALLLLTLGDVEGAVDTALTSRHLQLAMLISRCLEAGKQDLRTNVVDQLASCHMWMKNMDNDAPLIEQGKGCSHSKNSACEATASIDERMVLLLLSGRIVPIANYLKLSWYRVFIMELLYGIRSLSVSHAEQLSSAVTIVESSGVPTYPPHGEPLDVDAAYHLLKLFAGKISYSVSSGLYSSRSVGHTACPLNGEVPWLLHQLLSAVVPSATTRRASWLLAEAFCSQLQSVGLPLWGFYVLCSGFAPESVLKRYLIRSWPDLCNDSSDLSNLLGSENDRSVPHIIANAENFLASVLLVPVEWINEAKIIWQHEIGHRLEMFNGLVPSISQDCMYQVHYAVINRMFPAAHGLFDVSQLKLIRTALESLALHCHPRKFSVQGDIVLEYLRHLANVPDTQSASLEDLLLIVQRLSGYSAEATTPSRKYTTTLIVDAVLCAVRAHVVSTPQRGSLREHCLRVIGALPASTGTKKRICGELRVEVEAGESFANRYAIAFSLYRKYLISETTSINAEP